MLERRDHRDPDYKVDWWYHEGRIVLDHDNHPMRDFRDIPKTLASNVEDYIVEAILRTDQRITQVDIRARMPGEKVNIKGEMKQIGTLSMLNMRLKRFRWANALPPWCQRDCSENFSVYVKWKLSQTGSRQGIKNNSVEELESLTLLEQAEVEAMSKGKFGARAGKRALDVKVRVTRDESLEKRIKRLEDREGRKFRVLDLEKMKEKILLNTEPAPTLSQAIDHYTPCPQEPIFSEPAQSQFSYQTHQLQESVFPPPNIWQPQARSSNQVCAPWLSSEGPPAGKRSHADFLENHVNDPYEPRKQRKVQEISPFEADFSGASTYTNGRIPQYTISYFHPVPPQNHQAPAYPKEIMGGHPGMTFPTIPTYPGHSCHQPSNSNNLFTGLYNHSMNPALEQPLSCYPPSYQQQLTLPTSSGQITTPAILPLPEEFITPPLTLSAFSSPNQIATPSNDQTRPGHSYTPVTPGSPKIQQRNPSHPQTLEHRFFQPGDLAVNTFFPTIIEEEDFHRISSNYSENKPLRHEALQPLAALSTNPDGLISGIQDDEFTEMCNDFWTPGYSWMEDMNAKM